MSRDTHCPQGKTGLKARLLLVLCCLAVVPLLVAPGLTTSGEKGDDLERLVKVRLDEVTIRIVDNPQANVGVPTLIRLEVFNPNKEDLDKVTVVARLPNQLEHATRGQELVTSLIALAPREKTQIDLLVTARQTGRFPISVTLFAADRLTTNAEVMVVADDRPTKVRLIRPGETISSALPPAAGPGETHWVATLDGRTPMRELLPPVPQTLLSMPRYLLPESVDQVTEVAFQEPVRPDREKALNHTRSLVSKIMHLHTKRMDSYMEELIANRSDLQGLPFVLGAACRANNERMQHFSGVLQIVRGSMGGEFSQPLTAAVLARRETNDAISDQFWQNFNTSLIPKVTEVDKRGRAASRDLFREAHVAALMQVCGPEQGAMRKGLTRHMAGVPHASSSRALAKLAIFSPEEDVRREAIDSLKVRKDKDYADILVDGLRYPWPDVAKRASDAIIALERRDLVPALVNSLDDADPRMPREITEGGKKKHVIQEMVRMNHHRNCFMCHAPATPETTGGGEVLTGAVPIPGEPLPSFQEGYRNSTPELAVRIDVTYLRQDFSVFMKIENAHPWPEMQRFDFLTRIREVNDEELAAYRKIAENVEEGVLNPYQRAAVNALRELTGRDAAPTADAWRRVLKLPARGT